MITRISEYSIDVELKTNLTSTKLNEQCYVDILDRNNAFIDKQVFTTPRGGVCLVSNTIESQIKLSLNRTINRYLRTAI